MIPYIEPMKTPDGEPFWDGCKNNQLLIPKCQDCGQFHFYPRMLCPHCWSEQIKFEIASGQGTLYSYTRIFPKPPKEPYVVALVELKEGVRLMTNLLVDTQQELKVGMPMEVQFVKIPESETVLPQFVLKEAEN